MARDANKKLTKRINLRVTDEEYAEIVSAAAVAKASKSAYVVSRTIGRPVASRTDLLMINEVRRIGGLIKHHASLADRAAVQDTLAVLRQFIGRLAT